MSERVHVLKTAAFAWDAVERGEKTFEVRRNDRGYQPGDLVDLVRLYGPGEESSWNLHKTCYPERVIRRRIGWMLQGGQFGIEPGYCVFQLEPEAPNDP